MDKQSNVLFNTRFQELRQDSTSIPVNTRTIGAPEGIYILYLEDYVHTFIKKIVSNKKIMEDDLRKSAEYQIETNVSSNIALYGKVLEEGGRYRIVISGAALFDSDRDKIQQLNNTYFPSCTYIGTASASQNKDQGLRLELTLRSTKVILDDFYIYYDQNEEMQNYLVEWNNSRQNSTNKVILSSTEQDTPTRNHRNDAAHLSRIAQSYNREEAKVSFMWNVMNLLCLGFVVCVMAYGIISINNYNKMQHMQDSIDYCIAFISKNSIFYDDLSKTDADAVPTMQQTVPVGNVTQTTKENSTDTQAEKEQSQNITANQEVPTTQEIAVQQPVQEEVSQNTDIQPSQEQLPQGTNVQPSQETVMQQPSQEQVSQDDIVQQAQEQPAQDTVEQQLIQDSGPQYYVVRKGDTLQTICYSIYGDYSHMDEICRWNNIENPDNILYGQKLLLP